MQNNKGLKIAVVFVALLSLVSAAFGYTNYQVSLGGFQKHTNAEQFKNDLQVLNLAFGETVLKVLSGITTSSLSASDVCKSRIVEWSPTGGTGDLTLPTALTLKAQECLNSVGEMKILYYRNTSAATSTYFTAGASTTLQISLSSTTKDSTATTTLPAGDGAYFIFQMVTTTANASNLYDINMLKFE